MQREKERERQGDTERLRHIVINKTMRDRKRGRERIRKIRVYRFIYGCLIGNPIF
jgi:hypothetical protein